MVVTDGLLVGMGEVGFKTDGLLVGMGRYSASESFVV
jgi:hypothetical protein